MVSLGNNVNTCFETQKEDLLSFASQRIVRRGIAYAKAGRVTDLVEANGCIEARVQGSEAEPYLVSLEHDGEEILPSCSCPFDWEPFCKHAIAVLALRAGFLDSKSEVQKYISHTSLEDQEIAVRKQRAKKEGFRVRKREGNGFFGVFDVLSPSDKTYLVEIRSLTERINRCSCPDYAVSMLGTCKHIEAVLAARKKRAKRKFEKAVKSPPSIAQVFVEQGDFPRLCLRLPEHCNQRMKQLASEYFDADGYFMKDPVDDFSEFLNKTKRMSNFVIYGDAVEFSRQVADERKAKRRAEEVRQSVLAAGARIPGIKANLYPYQVEGTAFLASRGCALLGDDMGLGKTIQAIAAARVLWDRNEVRRVLVVCPASLKHQWAAEIERFCSLESQIIGGSMNVRMDQYRRRAPFTIMNYELALRDAKGLSELKPDLLILDEAQRIKNWRTKTANSIKGIQTRFAFVLTGTPLQNRLDDLYSVMQVVDRRIFGPLWAYNERFVVREEGRNRISGYKNLDELRRRLKPTVLRREKEEVKLQLPDLVQSRMAVELTEIQRNIMDEFISKAARLASIAEKRPLTPEEEKQLLMAMQCARMACNAAGLVDKETVGSPKLDEFEQLISDLCVDRGRKVVVFSEWEKFCRMAAQRAEHLRVPFVRLHGGVPTHKRGALIERFRDDPECRIFFSTDAGGVGLNLQFASTMINLELPWNPAVLNQRIGRLHRHGQTEPVHVLMLVSENSYEVAIEKVMQGKRSLFDAALSPFAKEDKVQAPSSCLSIVRNALFVLESEEGSGEEPVLEDVNGRVEKEPSYEEAEKSGSQEANEPDLPEAILAKEPVGVFKESQILSESDPQDPSHAAQKIAELLGSRLQKVVQLKSGRVVAAVDRVDEATLSAAKRAGLAVAELAALESLSALGGDSPLVGAKTLIEQTTGTLEIQQQRKKEHLTLANRKLLAAKQLASSELAAEAIGQAHAAMTSVLRAMSEDEESGNGLPSARLLYEFLVPRGLLSLEDAALISRAEGLARAYTESTTPVPAHLLQSVLADADRLLSQVETTF